MSKVLEKDMDNLLQKIYDTIQTGDMNIIVKEVGKIYNLYLTSDKEKKVGEFKILTPIKKNDNNDNNNKNDIVCEKIRYLSL